MQGTLFKVPRIGSSGDATAFEARFTSPSLDSDKPPGSSDANPIRLGDEVTESDFASFIITVMLGAGFRQLAIEVMVDKQYLRLAFVILTPIQVFFTLVIQSASIMVILPLITV